jgi:parallel beta-helix repeat protein
MMRAAVLAWAAGLVLAAAPQVVRMAPMATHSFTLAQDNPGLVWAVDGLPGGSVQTGTVARTGRSARYLAPAAGGSHLLTATGPSGPVLVAAITVQAACPPPPAAAGVNVQDPPYRARGDGRADDTAAIQRAIAAVQGTGGTVLIPAGTYLINTAGASARGLVVGGRMTLRMAPGAILKAIPNAAANSTIVSVAAASQVQVVGGTLLGDRSAHRGTAGEWGMGLSIEGSRQVAVLGVTARDCWGDGFYVSGSAQVALCSVLAEHNRRNGLSITGCDGITVRASVFRASQGTEPEDGLDIEPNAGQTVSHALITGCVFEGNAGSGLETGVGDSDLGRAFTQDVVIDGNSFTGNGRNPADGTGKMAIRVSNCPGAKVTGNIILDNAGQGIYLRYKAEDCLVAGNTVTLTAGDGIVQASCSGNRIQGNRVLGNSGYGIRSINCSGGAVSGNTVAGNGLTP